MKKMILSTILMILSFQGLASNKLPADITDDLMKTLAVELLINNIKENYQVTKLTAGRNNENGIELAAGFVWITRTNGKCDQVAAVVESDTCSSIDTCKLQAYLLDCPN